MKLVTKSTNSRVKEAVAYAEKYFQSDCFIRDISSIDKFDSSNVSPEQIGLLFHEFSAKNKVIEIKVTNFGWMYRSVLGRTVGNGFAYVNSWGTDRQVWDVAATVVHEASHIVDEYFPKARFGHGDNSSVGKKKTFPYFIGEKARTWIKTEVLKKEINRLAIKQVLLREVAA